MKWALTVVVLVAISISGCSAGPQRDQPLTPGVSIPVVQRGQVAPEFTLPQASGKPVSLAQLHGKPVLLYFSMGPG